MKLETSVFKKDYLAGLKQSLSSPLRLGTERFTGIVLGSFFYVTYHAKYEWNRRITSQTTTAMGFVRSTGYGCDVHYLRFRGQLAPHYVIFNLILIEGLLYLYFSEIISEAPSFFLITGILSALVILFSCAVSSFFERLTHESYMGLKYLTALLIDPTDPDSFSHNYEDLP